jgi:hypothetical protein
MHGAVERSLTVKASLRVTIPAFPLSNETEVEKSQE